MPVPLPNTDLSVFSVGQGGSLSLRNVGVSAGAVSALPRGVTRPSPYIYLFNESGSGLTFFYHNASGGFKLPAGSWAAFPLPAGESQLDFSVDYIIPNAPVQTLLAVYYAEGEPLPTVSPVLGNSPIGIAGNVNVSNVNTLSNEGNASNTLVIDMGDTAFSQIVTLYNDGHALWAVDQSGVSHQVIAINTSGNALQLGKSGDTVEVLGNLTVDQNETVTGTEIVASIANPAGGVSDTYLAVTGTGATMNTRVQSGNQISFQVPGGTTIAQITGGTTGGIILVAGSTRGVQWFNGNFFPEVSFFSGTGSGTYNHTFNGAGESLSPFHVIPIVNQVGSATQGYDTVTTSQVHITLGAALSFKALCV